MFLFDDLKKKKKKLNLQQQHDEGFCKIQKILDLQ
jgi:hypothetical protein